MTSLFYPAYIWHEDNVYYVQFLDFPNGFTFGKNIKDAKIMAQDVLSALLTTYLENNRSIPKPSKNLTLKKNASKKIFLIAPDAKIQAAMLLKSARANKTQTEIAQIMGTSWQAYQKIEKHTHNPSLATLQNVARALNKTLILSFR